MPEWWVCALALGATLRITRFLAYDTLAAPLRNAVAARYGDHSLPTEFSRCPWCWSIWVAAPVWLAAGLFGTSAWFWGPAGWLTLSLAAGLAGSWSAFNR